MVFPLIIPSPLGPQKHMGNTMALDPWVGAGGPLYVATPNGMYCDVYARSLGHFQDASRLSNHTAIRRTNCTLCSTRPIKVDEPLYGVPSDAMLC